MSDKQTVQRTFAASSLRQQESCVACFEQIACVSASCGAEIDLHSNLSNRRADWYGLQASRRPYASPAPVTPNNNAPFFSLKINHLQTLRAPQKRHAYCVFCCMTTTYAAQSGTACGGYEGRMLRLAAAGSSAKGYPPCGRCLRRVSLIIFQPEFAVDPKLALIREALYAVTTIYG